MKIRIKGNSVRFRLTKTEVENFAINGAYTSETELMGGVFKYRLQRSEDYTHLAAVWNQSENEIIFFMPKSIADEWTESNEVGFQHIQILPNGTELFLLVEKDFVCLDNTFEDQSDNYPNPNAVC
jgi:hypothetical protein